MPEYLHPGVYVSELPSGARPVEGASTSTACFIGTCAMGRPFHPQLVTSWPEFTRLFGGLDRAIKSDMPLSVQQFFANGGVRTYIIRVVADDAVVAATKKEFAPKLKFKALGKGAWGKVRVTIVQAQYAANAIDIYVTVKTSDGSYAELERFNSLGINESQDKYFVAMLSRDSNYIKVELDDTASDLPTLTLADFGLKPRKGEYNDQPLADHDLEGGTDGNSATAISINTVNAALASLDRVADVSILATPGVTDLGIVNAVIAYVDSARKARDIFYIVDSEGTPRNKKDGAVQIADVKKYTAGLAKSSYAGLYFPWVAVADPYSKVAGATRFCPPSGFVAGIFARTDNTRGVWKAPAGTEATVGTAVDVAVNLADADQDTLNPIGVNCIRKFDASGIVVWGARTLATQSDPEYRYIPIRRFAIFLRVSMYRGTQWVVFEPNDEPLWSQVRFNLNGFMLRQFRAGALQGGAPGEAFFVQCDATNNIQATIDAGQLWVRVGFAPLKPAEFVIIELQQIAKES